MVSKLTQTLAFKLYVSYLAVILVMAVVLALVAEFVIPGAFQRHMLGMQGMMGGGMVMFSSFRSGVNEALAIAVFVAVLSALVVSLWFSQKVTAPLKDITRASRRISDGHFGERVAVPGSLPNQPDELGQLAHAFNQMAERLENTERMRSQLLGDVSHELRTPLTAIKGSMEALVDGVLPAESATFLQIEQEADRLQRLVNDLQELSRVEAGSYDLNRQPIAIDRLVQSALERVRSQFQQKGVALTPALPSSGLPLLQGDPDRLLQVLINLLSNACQYTPAGGEVQVLVSLRDGQVLVAVTDNGIGIPPEHLPHLFTRFYRADKSRSRQSGGGSGIGLTIAKHLVEAHGGKIWAKSEGQDKGSTFAFSLPLQG